MNSGGGEETEEKKEFNAICICCYDTVIEAWNTEESGS